MYDKSEALYDITARHAAGTDLAVYASLFAKITHFTQSDFCTRKKRERKNFRSFITGDSLNASGKIHINVCRQVWLSRSSNFLPCSRWDYVESSLDGTVNFKKKFTVSENLLNYNFSNVSASAAKHHLTYFVRKLF